MGDMSATAPASDVSAAIPVSDLDREFWPLDDYDSNFESSENDADTSSDNDADANDECDLSLWNVARHSASSRKMNVRWRWHRCWSWSCRWRWFFVGVFVGVGSGFGFGVGVRSVDSCRRDESYLLPPVFSLSFGAY